LAHISKSNFNWQMLISSLDKIKPQYGSVMLELTYHQSIVKKAKILQKEEIIIFDNKKGDNNESI